LIVVFNKEELIERIKFIAIHKKYIHLENMDALKCNKRLKKNKNTIFLFDPPLLFKGRHFI